MMVRLYDRNSDGVYNLKRTNITEILSDWVVLKGPSMSLLTGPNRDHTTRNATGGYIIAQGFSAIFLSEFRFYSPSVDLTWSDDYCLRIGSFSLF